MKKFLVTILLVLSTCAYAEFKLDNINDLQDTLKNNEPQQVGITIGYVRGIEDGIMMMLGYQEESSFKFSFINPEKKWPSIYEMIELLNEQKSKHPTFGDLPLEHMILTTLVDNHYLEKKKNT